MKRPRMPKIVSNVISMSLFLFKLVFDFADALGLGRVAIDELFEREVTTDAYHTAMASFSAMARGAGSVSISRLINSASRPS